MIGKFVNNELERMWKEVVVAYFKVKSRNSPPRGTEEIHGKPKSRNPVPGRRSEPVISLIRIRGANHWAVTHGNKRSETKKGLSMHFM
jgi:hypothetical protein